MKHILYPTDFSENSEHALPYAMELARLFQAEVTLFNSYKLPYSKSNLLVSMTDRMKKDSADGLKKLKEKVLSDPAYKNLNISVESRSGGFVSLIPNVAEDFNSDLIVMGTKGASGLKEMFIGSNTLEVIQTTHCPVLAIPENAKDAQRRKFNKIAMATDLRKVDDPKQLDTLFEIAKICRAPVEFVNVIRPEDEIDDEERSKQVLVLEEMAKGVSTSIHFTTNSDIIDGLSDYINHKEPDLFAMLSRKHSLFERLFTKSITNKLSFRTEIPLLVIDE
ncbi:MAG: universal stress protein [Vicingaceae bacterium]